MKFKITRGKKEETGKDRGGFQDIYIKTEVTAEGAFSIFWRLCILAAIVFTVLKLAHVISWSWWWVPFLIIGPPAVLSLLSLLALLFGLWWYSDKIDE